MIPAQVETGEAPPDTGKSQLAAAGQEFAGTRPRFDLAFALGLVTAEKDTLLATLASNSESDFHLGLPASSPTSSGTLRAGGPTCAASL